MARRDPYESELLEPTRELFDERCFAHSMEVPIGWRKIDFVATDDRAGRWVAVELKISDWKGAMRQAKLNHLVAESTFVALWHKHLGPALRHRDWFDKFRIGLISVDEDGAEVLFQYPDNPFCQRRQNHKDYILKRLERRQREAAGGDGPVPLLSA